MISFNVLRSKMLSIELGSSQNALICQVIAWHHFLLSVDETTNKETSFSNALKLWTHFKVKQKNINKKLTVSLVSDLTNIPFETTRRKIKALVKKNWIFYSKKEGIKFNPASELNNKIVNIIHPYEKKLLKEFLVSYLMSGSDNIN